MASASQTAYQAAGSGSWWTQIIPVVIVLGGFSVYATWRAFEGAFFWAAPYLSPFYSPLIDVIAPLVALLAGAVDPGRTSGLSRNLLLLPQSLLSGIFPRSAGMRRR